VKFAGNEDEDPREFSTYVEHREVRFLRPRRSHRMARAASAPGGEVASSNPEWVEGTDEP
jgi:hypothetical protein